MRENHKEKYIPFIPKDQFFRNETCVMESLKILVIGKKCDCCLFMLSDQIKIKCGENKM